MSLRALLHVITNFGHGDTSNVLVVSYSRHTQDVLFHIGIFFERMETITKSFFGNLGCELFANTKCLKYLNLITQVESRLYESCSTQKESFLHFFII